MRIFSIINKLKFFIVPIVVLSMVYFLGAGMVSIFTYTNSNYNAKDRSGSEINEFSLKTLDNRTITNIDLSKKKGIIIFWAPWCGYSADEFKKLSTVQIPDNWEIITVVNESNIDALQTFVKKHGVNYPVIIDEKRIIKSVKGYPGMYVLTGDNNIAGPLLSVSIEAKISEASSIINKTDYIMGTENEYPRGIEINLKRLHMNLFNRIFIPLTLFSFIILLIKDIKGYSILISIIVIQVAVMAIFSASDVFMNFDSFLVNLFMGNRETMYSFYRVISQNILWGTLYIFGIGNIIRVTLDKKA